MSNYINRLASKPNSIKGLKGKRDNELFPLYNKYVKENGYNNNIIQEWYFKLCGTDDELIYACNNIPIELIEE